jgi:drug/metabolite transporter (DMT)-like permease
MMSFGGKNNAVIANPAEVLMSARSAILLLLNVTMMVLGQGLLKLGVTRVPAGNWSNLWMTFFSPYVLLGMFVYALSMLVWLRLLSSAPLSVVYPAQSIAYILGTAMAVLVFGERVGPTRWAGCMVILLGVYLVSKS